MMKLLMRMSYFTNFHRAASAISCDSKFLSKDNLRLLCSTWWKGGDTYRMKNKLLVALIAVVGIIGATALVSNIVSAHGLGFGANLDTEAQLLGMTADELGTALEEKTMPEILDQQGVTHVKLEAWRNEQELGRQAQLLDMSVDELKTELEGKTFAQLLDEKGITHTQLMEKRHELMKERMIERLQEEADAGTITQDEMQEHLDRMEQHQAEGGFRLGHGMGHGPF